MVNPAPKTHLGNTGLDTHLIFHTIDFLQFNADRMFTWLFSGNIAHPVRGQVGVSILKVRDLVFPARITDVT